MACAGIRRRVNAFVRLFFVTRKNDFAISVRRKYAGPKTNPPCPPIEVDMIDYLQYARVFLIPGTRPRASILAMAYLRTLGLALIVAGVLWDFFVWGSFVEPREDHVAWISRPTNWLLLLAIAYLTACIYASRGAQQYGISAFDPQPAPGIYVVIWNLFNMLMPLSVSVCVAHFTVLHTHDAAYVFAMISSCVTFVIVELYFGAHIATVRLVTAPCLALTLFFVYTAGAALIFDEVMYAPLNWRDTPIDAAICCVRLLVLTEFVGAAAYFIITARGEYMGTKLYRPDPDVVAKFKRGIFPPTKPPPSSAAAAAAAPGGVGSSEAEEDV